MYSVTKDFKYLYSVTKDFKYLSSVTKDFKYLYSVTEDFKYLFSVTKDVSTADTDVSSGWFTVTSPGANSVFIKKRVADGSDASLLL